MDSDSAELVAAPAVLAGQDTGQAQERRTVEFPVVLLRTPIPMATLASRKYRAVAVSGG